jgi:hypothetical protein
MPMAKGTEAALKKEGEQLYLQKTVKRSNRIVPIEKINSNFFESLKVARRLTLEEKQWSR